MVSGLHSLEDRTREIADQSECNWKTREDTFCGFRKEKLIVVFKFETEALILSEGCTSRTVTPAAQGLKLGCHQALLGHIWVAALVHTAVAPEASVGASKLGTEVFMGGKGEGGEGWISHYWCAPDPIPSFPGYPALFLSLDIHQQDRWHVY